MDTDTLRIVLFVLGIFFVAGIYFWDRRKHVDNRFHSQQLKRRNKRKKHSVFDQEEHRLDAEPDFNVDAELQSEPESAENFSLSSEPEAPVPEATVKAKSSSAYDAAEIQTDNLHFSAEPSIKRETVTETLPEDVNDSFDDFQLSNQDPETLNDKLSFSSNSAFEAFEAGADLPTKILQINIVARNNEISGSMIMDLSKELNLELGEFNIFHRMDRASGKSVFSMANIVEPGSFDKNSMQDFRTPGLTLFSQLPAPIDCLTVYSEMIDAAKRISYILGADMQDSSRSVMTAQSIEHEREEVVAYRHKLQMAMQS